MRNTIIAIACVVALGGATYNYFNPAKEYTITQFVDNQPVRHTGTRKQLIAKLGLDDTYFDVLEGKLRIVVSPEGVRSYVPIEN